MLPRADILFTIGYDGPSAVVDGKARKAYGSLSTAELAERGLFRAAYCSALLSGTDQDLEIVIAAWNKAAGTSYGRDYPFGRLFGVFPTDAQKSIVL